MKEVAHTFKDICGRLGFKEREEFAFFFSNMAFKEVSKLGDLGSHARGIRLFESADEFLHCAMVPQKILDLCRGGGHVLHDEREERALLIGKMRSEMLGEERADECSLLNRIGRPSQHHDPLRGLDLLCEEQSVIMIL